MFEAAATNLVPGDTNSVSDLFVRDLTTGVTSRVSVGTGGVQANGSSFSPAVLSSDGRFVAFSSSASNLVPGDTNATADVFLHDRQTSTTTRVSVGPGGTQGNGASSAATVDGTGTSSRSCRARPIWSPGTPTRWRTCSSGRSARA